MPSMALLKLSFSIIFFLIILNFAISKHIMLGPFQMFKKKEKCDQMCIEKIRISKRRRYVTTK